VLEKLLSYKWLPIIEVRRGVNSIFSKLQFCFEYRMTAEVKTKKKPPPRSKRKRGRPEKESGLTPAYEAKKLNAKIKRALEEIGELSTRAVLKGRVCRIGDRLASSNATMASLARGIDLDPNENTFFDTVISVLFVLAAGGSKAHMEMLWNVGFGKIVEPSIEQAWQGGFRESESRHEALAKAAEILGETDAASDEPDPLEESRQWLRDVINNPAVPWQQRLSARKELNALEGLTSDDANELSIEEKAERVRAQMNAANNRSRPDANS